MSITSLFHKKLHKIANDDQFTQKVASNRYEGIGSRFSNRESK